MDLQIKARNTEVADTVRRYAEQKLQKLERYLKEPPRIELELAVERNPSIANAQVAEATVWTKRHVLRARESSPDMRASIDQLADKLVRQVKREREKSRRRAPIPEPREQEAPRLPAQEPGTDDLAP